MAILPNEPIWKGRGLRAPNADGGARPGATVKHTFPEAFHAYWLRVVAERDCRATTQLEYR